MACENNLSDASREYNNQFLRKNTVKEHTDEEPNLCPLCNEPLLFYFINFSEKLLMCGNADCEFPFGYEEPQLVHVNEFGEEYRVKLVAGSTASSAIWPNNFIPGPPSDDDAFSETTILYQEPEENQSKCDVKENRDKKESTIDTDLKVIEDLNREYRSIKADDEIREQRQIKREKWIKKLLHLEEISGAKLLKPEEINLSKKIELKLEHRELMIDIDAGDGNSMVKVQVRDPNDCCDVDKSEAEEVPETPLAEDEDIQQNLIVIQDEDPHKFLQPLNTDGLQNTMQKIVIQDDQTDTLSQVNATSGSDLSISQNIEVMIVQDGQSYSFLQTDAGDNSSNSDNVEEDNGQPKQPDIPEI